MTYRIFFSLISIVCLGALGTALIAQYGFHLEPCAFCIYERYPYAIGFVLSLAGLKKQPWGPFLKKGLVLCFCAGVLITFYHVLVEHKWVAPPDSCVSKFDFTEETTIADLEAQIESQPRVVRCDVVPIKIFGLSLAEYNLIFSFLLILFCLRKAK